MSAVITVLTVTDPGVRTDVGDITRWTGKFERRFRIADEHEAWLRYHLAIAAGFEAKAEKVLTNHPERVDEPPTFGLTAAQVDEIEAALKEAAPPADTVSDPSARMGS